MNFSIATAAAMAGRRVGTGSEHVAMALVHSSGIPEPQLLAILDEGMLGLTGPERLGLPAKQQKLPV